MVLQFYIFSFNLLIHVNQFRFRLQLLNSSEFPSISVPLNWINTAPSWRGRGGGVGTAPHTSFYRRIRQCTVRFRPITVRHVKFAKPETGD